jgi:hypothetical protein
MHFQEFILLKGGLFLFLLVRLSCISPAMRQTKQDL